MTSVTEKGVVTCDREKSVTNVRGNRCDKCDRGKCERCDRWEGLTDVQMEKVDRQASCLGCKVREQISRCRG